MVSVDTEQKQVDAWRPLHGENAVPGIKQL